MKTPCTTGGLQGPVERPGSSLIPICFQSSFGWWCPDGLFFFFSSAARIVTIVAVVIPELRYLETGAAGWEPLGRKQKHKPTNKTNKQKQQHKRKPKGSQQRVRRVGSGTDKLQNSKIKTGSQLVSTMM